MIPPQLRGPILFSIFAAIATIALKTFAYLITDSVSLLSDALESGINLVAAVTAYVSLWYASRPIDATHTYGHEKIEFFSSGLEGALIMVAAVGIAWLAVHRLLIQAPLENLGAGTLIALAASAINFVVALVLLRAGRKHHSIVLHADGKHLMADVVTSVGVVAGLGIQAATGWLQIDSLVALGVAGYILWTGALLIRRSFDGLMDRALSEDDQRRIRETITSCLPADSTFHALRTRQAGSRLFADFHLLVRGDTPVREAHRLADIIEATLVEMEPRLELTIHIEPIEEQVSYADNRLAEFEPKPPGA